MQNQHPQRKDYNESLMQKRMALTYQKNDDGKYLAISGRLLESKEYRDSLEVLSLNRDLFLKSLEEPNSLFSKQLKELLAHQTKRITVLKPASSSFSTGNEIYARRNKYPCGADIRRNMDAHAWSSSFLLQKDEIISQPNRIVVLKPTSAKPREAKANLAPITPLSVPESKYRKGNLRHNDYIKFSEVAEEITQRTPNNLIADQNQKDEHSITDMFNGYLTDESSLKRSKNDYRDKEESDCSDSGMVTARSHDSQVNERFGSPSSMSSLNHASSSYESSVCHEAVKILSEGCASQASNASSHEQTEARKSSSTLGEMLAMPEVNKGEGFDTLSSLPMVYCSPEQETGAIQTCMPDGRIQEPFQNITRLKFLSPSTCYNKVKEKEEISSTLSRISFPKRVTGAKGLKISFNEKFSSLLLSRMRKFARDMPTLPNIGTPDFRFDSASSWANMPNSSNDEAKFIKPSSALNSVSDAEGHKNSSVKGFSSIEKLWKSEIPREIIRHAVPFSVVERPIQEDFINNIPYSCQHAAIGNPQALSKSPLMCFSRSRNRRSTHFKNLPPNSKLFKLFFKEDEEQERSDFIHKLLSSSNLTSENPSSILARSHSLDSPLNPILLDQFLEPKLEKAKLKKRRSTQRLLFDCVNVALQDIGLCALFHAYPWSSSSLWSPKLVKNGPNVADAVWCRVNDCLPSKEDSFSGKSEYIKEYCDYLVKKEVAGSKWDESLWLVLDELSKEIGEIMLEELVDDALAGLTEVCL